MGNDTTNPILDDTYQWAANAAPGSRDNIHLVDFDSAHPSRLFAKYDDRSLCGHWLGYTPDGQPSPENACVNCLRVGLSRGILEPTWAMGHLERATDTTKHGVEASPP